MSDRENIHFCTDAIYLRDTISSASPAVSQICPTIGAEVQLVTGWRDPMGLQVRFSADIRLAPLEVHPFAAGYVMVSGARITQSLLSQRRLAALTGGRSDEGRESGPVGLSHIGDLDRHRRNFYGESRDLIGEIPLSRVAGSSPATPHLPAPEARRRVITSGGRGGRIRRRRPRRRSSRSPWPSSSRCPPGVVWSCVRDCSAP